jgi:hypothetical protein
MISDDNWIPQGPFFASFQGLFVPSRLSVELTVWRPGL